MQPFSVSQPLTPLAKMHECASTIVVNNMSDTPLLIKTRTSGKKIQVAPVVFSLLPAGRQRVQVYLLGVYDGYIYFSGMFVDSGEAILNEVDSKLLNEYFLRMTPQAQQNYQYVEQVLGLNLEDQPTVKPQSGDFAAYLKDLYYSFAKVYCELAQAQTALISKQNLLQMQLSRMEIKRRYKEYLEAEVRQKGMFKKVFGVEYRHIWSLGALIAGLISGLAIQKRLA